MSRLFKRSCTPDAQREASLSREVLEVELELDILRKFLRAAPKIREDSRYWVPPPEEFVMSTRVAPSRAELKRIQRQTCYHAAKLVLLLLLFIAASIWFADRLVTVMG